MGVKELITGIIEEELKETDSFLVGVDSNQAETSIRFFIDGIDGVSIQLCSQLSRKVSRILDEEYTDDQPIRYEISSPGAEQPLVDLRQFYKHIGRELEVELTTGEIYTGELIQILDDTIKLSILISKHKSEEKTIVFNQINKSTVKLSFKRKKK
ncbi:MAG: Ribosome maturation factor RimP [Bacteroidia bacterium]|nr:MAG: Ribosome maturation factor RimP [Bacteroidia bacterium]